ncbi:MAG: multiheme c-type cytochrome [Candidatus Marinimicrobia bacterium]|nr:multiheme c-type cytochrome [Candidatus Neomarinimicrobiota bacterium]
MKIRTPVLLLVFMAVLPAAEPASGKDALGSLRYEDFEKPKACKSCHTRIYQQWQQAMMSQAYTHHWDEIEYWDLAVPHAEKDPEFKAAADGCNGCHAPLSYLSGDVPPPRPEENSRANESVSCDLCHSITAVDGEPVNFNWISEPGRTKYGAKEGLESRTILQNSMISIRFRNIAVPATMNKTTSASG